MGGLAEYPARADPEAPRVADPQETGKDADIVKLPRPGTSCAEDRCQRRVANFTFRLRVRVAWERAPALV